MRNTILASMLMIVPITGLSAPEKFTIDPEHTYPYFSINHLGFSTMQGRFNETSGKMVIDTVNKTGSIDIVINVASVDTAHKKRDDHLRSPDFLNAIEFPEIVYQSSKVTINDDSSALVEGTLTIMGTAKPVTLNVSRMHCGIHPMDPKKKKYVCGFDATTTIKRSDFGITYALPAVGDEMTLSFGVEAIRD
ncbi:hypothetical protein MNBD_GAMMA16-2192 [hydrothermal vent metagenome]|uniref:Lipid/polyisoprenoid-binding YceI-like domain-containing protein n=1 Tax=hydrothermal vent metagenome TaxID=652676 RepID=A0A3B0YVS0_9ZZZZ